MQLLSENGGENETMNLKNLTISLALIAFIALATVAAATIIIQYWYPNTGTIVDHPELTMRIEGTVWLNNTAIDWGACEPGSTYLMELNVTNTGNMSLTVQIIPYGLPSTWQLTWAYNNTLFAIGESKMANLELTIPSDATSWPTWGFYVNGN